MRSITKLLASLIGHHEVNNATAPVASEVDGSNTKGNVDIKTEWMNTLNLRHDADGVHTEFFACDEASGDEWKPTKNTDDDGESSIDERAMKFNMIEDVIVKELNTSNGKYFVYFFFPFA